MEYLDVSGLVGKALRVVHVIIGLKVGGAELMLKRLIESHLKYPNIEHIVISLTDKGVLGEDLADIGVSVYCLGMTSILKGTQTFYKLRKLLQKLWPDVIHTWMYHADLLGGLAAHSIGIRNIVWCIRSTDIQKGGSKVTLLIRKICARLSGWLPRVIVCAADASRKAHETVGYTSSKMQVISNGFELEKLLSKNSAGSRIRDELGISNNCTLIVSVGRFNPVKDHKTFIEAAGRVLSLHGNVKFLLVGRDLEQSNPQLMAMINGTGKSDAFYLLGERNDVPACLQASDIFCLHSISEGFPNVLGEAMAVGLPCITTDVGDAAYLLANPEWVVQSASPDRFAGKLDAMLNMRASERVALGQAAASRIRQHFTMDIISRRYLDLYDSLMDA